MKYFITTILLIASLQGFSQNIKTTPFSMDKKTICSRIAWVDENRFAIISDKPNQEGTRYVHFISVYNGDSLIRKPEKVVTGYSLTHNYTIILGKKIFFCGNRVTEMEEHIFDITNTINENGEQNENVIHVFNVWHGRERKKLNATHYSFTAHEGIHGQRALLTYNNDYKDPYCEGFLFRILNENSTISAIDTLNLPYLDRACNIEDIIYDDAAGKIYMLCDLFDLVDQKKRTFKKSFLACYDINNRTYTEMKSSIPSLYKNSIQHLAKNDTLIFASIKPVIDNHDNWTSLLMTVKTNPFEVTEIISTDLKASVVDAFFKDKRKEAETNFIIPASNIQEYKKGCYNVGWLSLYNPDQLDQNGHGEQNAQGAVVASAFMFGIVGGLIAEAATAGSGEGSSQSIRNVTGNALWLIYDSAGSQPLQKMSNYHLLDEDYSSYSYTTFCEQENIYDIYNMISAEKGKYWSINVDKLTGTHEAVKPSILETIKKFNINTIHTRSLYTKDGNSYIIGEYNPKDDPQDKPAYPERKYFLIPLN